MRCKYCDEEEAIYEVEYDKNCSPAGMCKRCALEFKPSARIFRRIDGKEIEDSELNYSFEDKGEK